MAFFSHSRSSSSCLNPRNPIIWVRTEKFCKMLDLGDRDISMCGKTFMSDHSESLQLSYLKCVWSLIMSGKELNPCVQSMLTELAAGTGAKFGADNVSTLSPTICTADLHSRNKFSGRCQNTWFVRFYLPCPCYRSGCDNSGTFPPAATHSSNESSEPDLSCFQYSPAKPNRYETEEGKQGWGRKKNNPGTAKYGRMEEQVRRKTVIAVTLVAGYWWDWDSHLGGRNGDRWVKRMVGDMQKGHRGRWHETEDTAKQIGPDWTRFP